MTQLAFPIATLSMALLFALPGRTRDASDALDPSIYENARTIEVVTSDEDGGTRETTIWVVVVDGLAYINTHDTTWGDNVLRTPRLEIRLDDSSQIFDIRFLEDVDERARIHAALRKKYGWQDKLMSLFIDPTETTLMQLVDPQDPQGGRNDF